MSAVAKARATGRWAEIMFRALSARVARRWRFVSFRGASEGEWRGVVDIVAIRKNTSRPLNTKLRPGDLFDIVLVQVKGGGARGPSQDDCRRLRELGRIYRAKRVVQFHWRKGVWARFSVLDQRTLRWLPATSVEIFG